MNPYDVLGLEPGAANAAIIQAAARALKAKRFDAKAVAEAQRALLDPGRRPLADFLRPAIPVPRRFVPPTDEPATTPLPEWPERDPAALLRALEATVEEDRRLASEIAVDTGAAQPLPAYPQRVLEVEVPQR